MLKVEDQTWKSFSRTCWMLWGLNWGCSIYKGGDQGLEPGPGVGSSPLGTKKPSAASRREPRFSWACF